MHRSLSPGRLQLKTSARPAVPLRKVATSLGNVLLSVCLLADFALNAQTTILAGQAARISLGETVKGQIARAGGVAEYSFPGKAGQRIYLDGLEPDNNGLVVQLTAPSGKSIGSATVGRDGGLVILGEDGDYTVLVDGIREATGEFVFRILDASNAGPIVSGKTLSGALSPQREVVLYSWSGLAGQKLKLESVSAGGAGANWSLYSPADQLLSSRNIRSSLGEFLLPMDGIYLVAIEGTGTGLVPLTYQFTGTLTDEPKGQSAGFGEILQGTLNAGTNRFNFEGVAGKWLYFDSLSRAASQINFDIRSVSQPNTILFSGNASSDSGPHQLPSSGPYLLTLRGTGTYKVRLVEPGSSKAVQVAETIGGDLEAGETAFFKLPGKAGQRWYYDGLDSDFDQVTTRLLGPDGRVVHLSGNADSDAGVFSLAVSGDYFLVVENGTANKTDFQFQILDVDSAPSLEIGANLKGDMVPASRSRMFRFDATAGEKWFFDGKGTSAGAWSVFNPANQAIKSSSWNNDLDFTSDVTGRYVLVLSGNGRDAASYDVTVDRASISVQPIGLGAIVTGRINKAGGSVIYEFQGLPGMRLFYDGMAGFSRCQVRGVAPSGADLFQRSVDLDVGPFTLTEAGLFRLAVQATGGETGEFSFRLYDLSSSPVRPLQLNAPTGAGIVPVPREMLEVSGSYINYSLRTNRFEEDWRVTQKVSGTRKDVQINFTQDSWGERSAVGLSGGTDQDWQNFSVQWDGSLKVTGNAATFYTRSDDGSRFWIDLDLNGRFETNSVEMIDNGWGTAHGSVDRGPSFPVPPGAYPIRLQYEEQTGGNEMVLMWDAGSSIQPANATHIFRYEGRGGERLFFQGLSAPFGGSWAFYGPGNELVSSGGLTGSLEVIIPRVGSYFLVVSGTLLPATPYSFRVNTSENIETDLAFGEKVEGFLQKAGDVHRYRFRAVTGQKLYYDSLESSFSGIQMILYGPSGEVVLQGNRSSDRGPILLTQSGIYTLAMDGQGALTGAYAFRLIDLDQSPVQLLQLGRSYGIQPVSGEALKVIGSYVNTSLRNYAKLDDWRISQVVSGQRADPLIDFDQTGWGSREEVKLTRGSDANWDEFSVQWDGEVEVRVAGTRFYTRSDDGSRLQIDLNGDGIFAADSPELLNNSWGLGQSVTTGPASVAVAAGKYKIRLQYEEGGGGNEMHFLWDLGERMERGNQAVIYRVEGRSGQQLYFDFKGHSSQANWFLYDSTGRLLGSGNIIGDGTVTMASDGSHYLVLDGAQVDAVPFGLRVTAVTRLEVPVVFGQIMQSRIANPGDESVFQFDGKAGQRFVLDWLSPFGAPLRLSLTGPSGGEITSLSPNDSSVITLRENGLHKLKAVATGGWTGDFRFRVINVDDAVPMTFGSPQTGKLEPASKMELYRFSGITGQRISLSGASSIEPVVSMQILSPSGRALLSGTLRSRNSELTLDATGNYAVVVSADNNPADSLGYQFQINLNEEPKGTPVGFGPVMSGNITSGTTNRFNFEGVSGHWIYFDSLDRSSTSVVVELRELSSGGAVVFSSAASQDVGPFQLPRNGNLQLMVRGNGVYRFRVLDFEEAPGAAVEKIIQGELLPLETTAYRIEFKAGQRLLFDSVEQDSQQVFVRLYGPDGRIRHVNGNTDQDVGLFTIDLSGKYFLTVENGGTASGDYGFRFLDLAQAEPIESLKPVVGTLVPGHSSKLFRLTGRTGQRWYFDSSGTNGGTWTLFGTRNEGLAAAALSGDFESLLTVDGEYALVVSGRSESASGAGYSIRMIQAASRSSSIEFGKLVTESIEFPGEQRVFEFLGNVGQRIYVDGLEGFSGNNARLISPQGIDILSMTLNSDRGPLTLPAKGLYQFVVDGNGMATGGFSFQILDCDSQQDLVAGRRQSIKLDPGQSSVVFRVLATQGQKLYFDNLLVEGNGSWILYNPVNSSVAASSLGRDFELVATQTGVHFLVLAGASDKPVSSTFALTQARVISTELDFGSINKGQLLSPGDQLEYVFKGAPGQRILVDSIQADSANFRLNLVNPSGQVVSQSSAANDLGPLTLGESGVYKILVDASGDTVGTCVFRVLDFAAQPALRYNNPVEGTLESGKLSMAFRLSVTGKERLYFNGQGLDSRAAWYLYGTGNEILGIASINNDFEYVPKIPGELILVIAGQSADPVKYFFEVNSTSSDTGANTAPSISQIADQSAGRGKTVGPLSFVVDDAETAPGTLKVTAQSANTSVVPDSALKIDGDGSRRTLTVEVPADASAGSALITVAVTDEGGARAVRTFTIAVSAANTPPRISAIADQITRESKPTVAIKFEVEDQETPAAKLQLAASTSDPNLLPVANIVFGGLGGARTATLYPVPGRSGLVTIQILVMDLDGLSSSQTFSLTIAGSAVSIITQPAGQTIKLGDDAKFAVAASGSGKLTYQWKFNGIDIPGADSAVLKLEKVGANRAGLYTVTITNPLGSVTSSPARLVVLVPPVISNQPRSQIVQVGASVTFSVGMEGAGPFSYQWKLNGVNIPGAIQSSFVIPSAGLADSGTYRVAVSTISGTILSDPAGLLVSADTIELSDLFASRGLLNTLQGIGRGTNLRASREPGEPRHAGKAGGSSVWIQWVPPASGLATVDTKGSTFDTILAVYSGDTLATLVTLGSDDDTAGFGASRVRFNAVAGTAYQIAVDGVGGAQGQVVLNWELSPVQSRLPFISQHPRNQVVLPGSSATFSVVAANPVGGPATISYRWFFNGNPINGAVSDTLRIDNVQAQQLGDYFVEVSNPTAALISQSARLQINVSEGAKVNNEVSSEDKFSDAQRFLDFVSQNLGGIQPASTRPARPRQTGTALARGYSGTQIFSSYGSGTEEGEPQHCGVIGGASQWASYAAEADGILTVTTDGSDFDTVLAIYTGPGTDFSSLVLVSCDNDSGSDGKDSRIIVPVTAGTVYYIAVDGVNGATGTASLSYSLDAPSRLQALGLDNDGLRLSMSGLPGREYTLEWTSDFVNWSPLVTTNLVNGVAEVRDGGSPVSSIRYYRSISVP